MAGAETPKRLSDEILRKVRQIEVTTRKSVDDLMSGSYKSHFKGQGVQFSEHRLYVPGDDVRHIDWKVSARSRDPLIKKYDEERELTVFLIVDVSASQEFGAHEKLKSEVAAEIGGLLSYAATHSGDKVGMLLFAGENEKIIPPRKGKKHILRMIQEILSFQPKTKGTNLAGALESADRIMKHKGIVFVISDFQTEGYETTLRRVAKKHDVVCMQIGDQREQEMPPLGVFYFRDPESGEESWVDTRSAAFRDWLKNHRAEASAALTELFKKSKAELLPIRTHEDYLQVLVSFFQRRARKGSARAPGAAK